MLPTVAVIVVLPKAIPVTRPELSMVAFDASEVCQITVEVISWVEASS